MRRGALPLGCAALTAAFACTDLSNLSGGGASDPDASTTGAEAGTDASPTTGARFCESRDAAATLFCDDFDDPSRTNITQTGWQRLFGYALGDVTTDQAYSAPRSGVFLYSVDAGTPRCTAVKLLNFAKDKTELVFSARARVVGGSAEAAMTITDGVWIFRWDLSLGAVLPYANGNALTPYGGPAPPSDTWSPVRFSVKRTNPMITVNVRVGEGPSAASVDHEVTGAFGDQVTVGLGNSVNDANGGVYFDDVVVEAD